MKWLMWGALGLAVMGCRDIDETDGRVRYVAARGKVTTTPVRYGGSGVVYSTGATGGTGVGAGSTGDTAAYGGHTYDSVGWYTYLSYYNWDTCFVAGTMVDTPLGPRPIETLRVGDAVWSYDTAENRRVVGSVSHTMRRVAPASLELSVAGQRIQTTAEHPFFEPITKQWVEARELRMGHPVARWSVGELVVDHVRQSVDRPGPVEVFNITVSAHHDYFVEGLLVHNKSPPYSIYTNTEPITPTNNGDTYNTYYDYYSAGDTASSGPTTAPTTDESPEETGGGEGKVDEGDCGCRSAGSGTAGWGLILLGALVRRRRTNQARM